MTGPGPSIEGLEVQAYEVPTEAPESDGTFTWDSTTIVVVHASAGGCRGLGYTYGHAAAAEVCRAPLGEQVSGRDAFDVAGCYRAMVESVRNIGRPGLVATAVSAVDMALWDLKAKLLDLSLASLLGRVRDEVPAYGSGGFTSLSVEDLQAQLVGFVEQGARAVKMKVGCERDADPGRVAAARAAIGPDVALYVDANGAYRRHEALVCARRFAEHEVTWIEEPVSSRDLDGMRWLRQRLPAGMELAAGEYAWGLGGCLRLLQAEAVDVLMPDVTRVDGVTGFRDAAALARAFEVPLSCHCAPSASAHVGCALADVIHVEHFFDHARLEATLFDGAIDMQGGALHPDLSRPGLGLALKHADAERFRVA